MFEIKKIGEGAMASCTNCCTEEDLTEVSIGVTERFTRSKIWLCSKCLQELKSDLNKVQ